MMTDQYALTVALTVVTVAEQIVVQLEAVEVAGPMFVEPLIIVTYD